MVWGRVLSGIIFIVIAVAFYMETKNFPNQLGRDVGGAFWPKILIIILIVFSIWLIITGFINKQDKKERKEPRNKFTFSMIKPFLGIIICIGFVFLFKPLGYIISVFLFYILLSHTMYEKFEWKFFFGTSIQAVLLVLVIYFLFVKLLSVNLPIGVLG